LGRRRPWFITRLLSRAEQRLGINGIIVKIWLSSAATAVRGGASALFSQQFALAPREFRSDTCGMGMFRSAPRLVAVLGPTNTGKTHYAIERMLDHQSGMIGFPLRLLARENYDRVVKLRGARAVALITGEEKILPPNPSYFV